MQQLGVRDMEMLSSQTVAIQLQSEISSKCLLIQDLFGCFFHPNKLKDPDGGLFKMVSVPTAAIGFQ